MEGPLGGSPVEFCIWRGVIALPADPGGEDAVEDGLDESGTEEVFALFAGEFHSEGVFEGGANILQGREVCFAFDAGEGVAGVGREKPGEVFGIGEGGIMEAGAFDEFEELIARGLGGGMWMGSYIPPEIGFGGCQGERFAGFGIAAGVGVVDGEVAEVGDDDDAIAGQIIFHLPGLGDGGDFGLGPFDFHGAACGELAGFWIVVGCTLKLVGGEQAAVGNACALVTGMDNAADYGSEGFTYRIEQIGKCGVIGSLSDARAGIANGAKFVEVGFEDALGRRARIRAWFNVGICHTVIPFVCGEVGG